MAAKQPRLGVSHPTVVPTNFDRDAADLGGDEESDDSAETE